MDNLELTRDYLKDRYFFELDRKDRITNNSALPISIFTILSGAIIYYIKNPLLLTPSVKLLLFSIFSLIFLFSMVAIVYYVFRIFIKHSYGYIVSPKDFHKYYTEIEDYAVKYKKDSKDSYVRLNLLELMADEYRNHGQINLDVNRKRTAFLYKAKLFSFISVITIAPVVFLYTQIPKADSIQNKCLNVTIKGGILNVSTRNESNLSDTTTTAASTATSASTATTTSQRGDNSGGGNKTKEQTVKKSKRLNEPSKGQ
jgi:hypothetical protein